MSRQSQYPMIVKLHGKHDPTYYIVNSREDEYRAYYSILADHASMGDEAVSMASGRTKAAARARA